MIKVWGFDFDGTLVETFGATPLRGVEPQLDRHAAAGDRVFVATNQAGPVFRAMLGAEKFPTPADVIRRLEEGLGALELGGVPLYVCCGVELERGPIWQAAAWEAFLELAQPNSFGTTFSASYNPDDRKPRPGMLLRAADLFGVEPAEICYVGDRPEDRAAALAAGCYFLEAAYWRRGMRVPMAGPGDGPPKE